MIHCRECGAEIKDVNLRVHSTYTSSYGLENDSVDVEAVCSECKHKMWARICQEDITDVL